MLTPYGTTYRVGGGTSGFSAYGNAINVDLGGNGSGTGPVLTWGTGGFNPGTLVLNDLTATAGLIKGGWIDGDFNHNGTIDAADYALIDAAYQAQVGTLADEMIALHAAEFGADYQTAFDALSATPIPEPSALALLVGSTLLLKRRRR